MNLIEVRYSQNPLQIFAWGYSTPVHPRSTWDSYQELQTKYLDLKIKEEKVIQQLKELSMSDVEKARVIAKRAMIEFSYSYRLKQFFEVLKPPAVSVRSGLGLSREQEFKWIKENKRKYKGQWVALHENRCVAAGGSFVEVRKKAKEEIGLENILIVYFSRIEPH